MTSKVPSISRISQNHGIKYRDFCLWSQKENPPIYLLYPLNYIKRI